MLNIMNTNQTQRPVFKHGCLLFINIVRCKGSMSVITGHREVDIYIDLNLVKVKTDESGWVTIYLHKTTNQYWVQTYPNSEMHGGGQPKLEQIAAAVAKKKFDV